MAALPTFLQGFRLVTGDALNNMINVINNLTGFGTAQAGTFTTVTSTGSVESLVAITADGAVSPNTAANYVVTKAGVLQP
jgi:hypothetical protein